MPTLTSLRRGRQGRRRRRGPALALVVTLAAAALIGPASQPSPAAPAPGAVQSPAPFPVLPLRIGTWNTDLQPWLPSQPGVVDAVAASDLDVLGLQGVWSQAAADAITGDPRVRARYPYSYAPPAAQELGACGAFVPISTQEDFIRSVTESGVDTRQVVQPPTPLPFTTRLLGLDLLLTSQPCFAAIVNTMQAFPPGTDPLTAIDKASDGNGQRYGHGGLTGQLVLSRTPITDVSVFAPESLLDRTATVYATVGGVRMAFADWPRNVLADFDPIFAPFQAYALQPQYAEDLIATQPDVVVGTLNSGPGYQSEGYDALVSAGYAAQGSVPTYCPTTTHTAFAPCQVRQRDLTERAPDLRLDHVLVRAGTTCGPVTTLGAGVPVSDHIGLATTCRRAFPATAVLDAFDRADRQVGRSWVGFTGTGSYQVTAGRLAVKAGGPMLWAPTTYGPDQEAYVRLGEIAPRGRAQGVLLKASATSLATTAGISVTLDAAAGVVRVSALRLGSRSWTDYPALPASFSRGDVLGARALSNGTVEVYRNATLLGTVNLSAGDRAWFAGRGGRVGLATLLAPGTVLDDVGGGSL